MLEPVRVIRDISLLLARSGAVRDWVSPTRMVDHLWSAMPLSEDPLSFMEEPPNASTAAAPALEIVPARRPDSRPTVAPDRLEPSSSARLGPSAPIRLEPAAPFRFEPLASASSTVRIVPAVRSVSIPAIPVGQAPPGGAIIDARSRFEARSRSSRMAAVEDDSALYGPRGATPLRIDGWRDDTQMPQSPLRLVGQGAALWYRVDADSLAARIEIPPVTLAGRGLLGICLGSYSYLEPASADELGDRLIELSVVALASAPTGPRLIPLTRLVDTSSRSGALRFLAYQRPREPAHIELERSELRWSMSAKWRTGAERIELELRDDHWLNRLGFGPLVWLASRQVGWQVGGRQARLSVDPRQSFRVGRIQHIRMPWRLHAGLLAQEVLERPLSVTLMPQLQLVIPP